jgi:DNA mismatch repair protein MutS
MEMTGKDNTPPDFSFSLLWPGGERGTPASLSPQTAVDLDIKKLVHFISTDNRAKNSIERIFTLLCQDSETITYRLDIIDDVLNSPALISCLWELTPVISSMRFFVSRSRTEEKNALIEVVWRLRELEYYVKCIQLLSRGLKDIRETIRSEGIKKLALLVDSIENNPVFVRLIQTLPGLLEKISNLKSITIGVNLNNGLIPFEATLLSINDKQFTGAPLWGNLFQSKHNRGIAELHSAPVDGYTNPLMVPLFKDIDHITQKMTKPIARSLKKFISINSRLLIKLQQDFLFYLGAIHMIQSLRKKGLPMTRPVVLEKEKRKFSAQELYNINLAIHLSDNASSIVKNNFSQDEAGRIIILTGPNRGGKTTLLQAVGLTQILTQAGLYVPAEKAEVSICDNIFTHYPAKEELEKGTGRFGEEAQRLHSLFQSATRYSLILLNESLSSTSIGESLYLAQDIIRVLRALGVRVIFTTHLHDLAGMVDTINNDTRGDSRLLSMVAQIKKIKGKEGPGPGHETITIKPTFKILPGPPMGQSYALELATKFGISKDQLLSQLKERGQLPPDE